ncbi:hypothetical protein BH23GEM10_BH23GEM10_03430 [soil metagenome]
MTFTTEVYMLVARVPRGRVVSYGGVAAMLERPRAARAVGQALRNLPDDVDVPWWRVLDANGRITKRGMSDAEAQQRRLLEEEGVKFGRSGRVNWERYGWEGDAEEPGAGAADDIVVKQSVAVVIRDAARPGDVLVVQRPSDDDELPNAWGLPAATLREGELWADAVLRAGRDKLGITLDAGTLLESGSAGRDGYMLEMRLYEARIADGEPAVPQTDAQVTQYQAWRWGWAEDLRPAAASGSLCCQLYLRAADDGAKPA